MTVYVRCWLWMSDIYYVYSLYNVLTVYLRYLQYKYWTVLVGKLLYVYMGQNFQDHDFAKNWSLFLTLSINFSILFIRMVKTKTFPMISLKRRVIIYVSFFHKLAVCMSICLFIFLYSRLIRITLWAPEYKKIDRQIDRHIANYGTI